MRNNNRQWILKKRPVGDISKDDLELIESNIPEPKDGEALLQNVYLSLDPTNRIWMSDMDQYMPPVELNEVMRGGVVGKIIKSNHSSLPEGSFVSSFTCGWQDYCLVKPEEVNILPRDLPLPLTAYMSAAGLTGFTAYFGFLSITKPKEGETVVVSTAAGAVGSIVGQLAKMKGCKVIGLTGSDEKCKWLREELCFDGAINYKTGDVLEELKTACPEGIDIYFDNTGGIILDAVLKLIKLNARISVCGLISTYNSKEPAPGPYNYGNILMKRAKVEGCIVSDFAEEFPNALNDLSNWILEGKIKYNVDIQKGLENALVALDRLFTGDNTGKLILEVSKEEG